MSRPHRTDDSGAVHHVMIRGVDGRMIFVDDFARVDFLARFALLVRELGFVVLAWCLLGNHAHFVIQTGPTPLAALMARLNSRHAQRYNRVGGRRGHLFQDRYKAVLITSEGRLARDVAYALGNPLRHGLLSKAGLEEYRFSGYSGLVGRRPLHRFESPAAVAAALGVPRDRIASFVHESALEPDATGAALEPDQIAELDLLIRDCCKRREVEENALRAANGDAHALRAEICAIARGSLDLQLREIARRLGISYRTAKRIVARMPVA